MKTVINIKTDPEVKENAKKTARELGVPLSIVINAYLKQFIRSKEVYLSSVPKMTPALEELLGKIEKDIKNRRNLSPALGSSSDLERYLSTL